MHNVNLGTGRDFAAELIRMLDKNGALEPIEGTPREKLWQLTLDHRKWCSDNGLTRPRGIYTPSSVGWGSEMPELSTKWKAASVRQVLEYLCHRICKLAETIEEPCDVHVAATAAMELQNAEHLMDRCSYVFSVEESRQYHDSLMIHLRCMSRLASEAKSKGVLAWKLRFVYGLTW